MTVLEAKVRLVDSPPGRTLVALGFDDVYAAADDVPNVMESDCIACEGMDHKLVRTCAGVGSIPTRWADVAQPAMAFCSSSSEAATERKQTPRRTSSSTRSRAAVRTAHTAKSSIAETKKSTLVDSRIRPGRDLDGAGQAAHVARLGRLCRAARAARRLPARVAQAVEPTIRYDADMYGHFGQGVLHCRIDFGLLTEPGLHKFRSYLDEAADLVVDMGGSLSGEHGDGQARADLLPIMYGDELVDAFAEFKCDLGSRVADEPGQGSRSQPDPVRPEPGRGLQPAERGDPLRLRRGPRLVCSRGVPLRGRRRLPPPRRRHDVPSYMVTREEKHSTRGRARMLFEMMRGRRNDRWLALGRG